jgi:hypothetical protein
MAMKLRPSSSSSRCCGVILTALSLPNPSKKVAYLDTERLSDVVEAPRGGAIDPLLVLVRLLVGDPDQLGHLMLGQPEHNSSLAHAGSDMPVGILRTRSAGTRFMLALITVAIVFRFLTPGRHTGNSRCMAPLGRRRAAKPWSVALHLR